MREFELDSHFSSCNTCSTELNHQKLFLNQLNSRLSVEDEIELPKDFTRQIVVRAESSVTGLRRPREQFNAVFIIATLLVFIVFAMGAGAEGFFSGFASVFEKVTVVGGFFGRMIYSFFVGIVVVLRTLAPPLQSGLPGVVFGLSVFAAVAVLLSKMFVRLRRI